MLWSTLLPSRARTHVTWSVRRGSYSVRAYSRYLGRFSCLSLLEAIKNVWRRLVKSFNRLDCLTCGDVFRTDFLPEVLWLGCVFVWFCFVFLWRERVTYGCRCLTTDESKYRGYRTFHAQISHHGRVRGTVRVCFLRGMPFKITYIGTYITKGCDICNSLFSETSWNKAVWVCLQVWAWI